MVGVNGTCMLVPDVRIRNPNWLVPVMNCCILATSQLMFVPPSALLLYATHNSELLAESGVLEMSI